MHLKEFNPNMFKLVENIITALKTNYTCWAKTHQFQRLLAEGLQRL